jgi:hypothetical protein
MSFMKQPEPMLRDDPTLPSDLRAAFAAYRDVAPSSDAREALFASLEPSLTTAPGVPSRLPRTRLWLVGLALIGVMVAGSSWRTLPSAAPVTPNGKAPVATPAARAVVETEPSPPLVQTVVSSRASPEPVVATRRGERRRGQARTRPAPASDPTAELALLTRAKRTLPSDASAALGLTREHQATFPRGTFAEEREVIAIEALARMGDTAAALRRTAAFRAAYPHSAHLERLRVVLAEP